MVLKIENLEELRAERFRIRGDMTITSQKIYADFKDLEQSLNPVKVALNLAKSMLFNQHGGIVHDSLRTMVGDVSSHKLLSFMPWPMRMISSYLLKNVISNYVYDHKDSIADKALGIVSKLKNLLKKNPEVAQPIPAGVAAH